jgi:dTDP-glucose 4,6-dehydratase
MKTTPMLSKEDIDHVLTHTSPIWEKLRGARLFVTGGTGFVGKWLLESFVAANEQYSLRAEAVVLSRRPSDFKNMMPHLAVNSGITLWQGDVRNFDFPEHDFTHVIHAATDVVAGTEALETFDVTVSGTRRVLDFCKMRQVEKLLLLSSGAVYGRQPVDLEHVTESYVGAPQTMVMSSAYGIGKRASEWLACAYSAGDGAEVVIARCFAFVGPYLPIDKHFAIGNFIRDALAGGEIKIGGDGTPLRSYLYAADLAVWLWTILVEGKNGAVFNVGSDQGISILDLARTVAQVSSHPLKISVAKPPIPGAAPEKYVPDVSKARAELGLDVLIPLTDSIQRTMNWHYQMKRL